MLAISVLKKLEGSTILENNVVQTFATGLVAGGALAGVLVAILSVNEGVSSAIERLSVAQALEHSLGAGGYQLLGVIFFAIMGYVLYRISRRPSEV